MPRSRIYILFFVSIENMLLLTFFSQSMRYGLLGHEFCIPCPLIYRTSSKAGETAHAEKILKSVPGSLSSQENRESDMNRLGKLVRLALEMFGTKRCYSQSTRYLLGLLSKGTIIKKNIVMSILKRYLLGIKLNSATSRLQICCLYAFN